MLHSEPKELVSLLCRRMLPKKFQGPYSLQGTVIMIDASEARYRRLFEGMRDGYVRTNLDGKIQEFNTAYLKMNGYSEEELLSMAYKDLTPEKWRSMEGEIMEKQTLANGYSELYEKEYRRKDGTLVPVELRTYLERDEDNKPVGYWAIIRDISNRMGSEEALRSSELMCRQLAEQLLQGIVLIQETGIVFVNQAFADITGISIEEAPDMDMEDIWEMIHPDDRSLLIRGFADMFGDQEMPPSTEFRVIRKDGGVRWIEGYVSTIDFDGEVTIQAVMHDTTEKRQAEQDLRKSEQKYHMLFDTSMDGIAFTSMDGAYLEVNRAFSDMIGYSQEELFSMDYLQVTPERWREREQEIHETQVMQRGYSDEYEKEYRRKDGTIIPAMVRTWLVRDENGKPAHAIATVRDITDRKRAEDELRESEETHRTLINSMQDLVLVYDEEDRHAQVYAGSEGMLYVSPEEFLTKRIVDVLPMHASKDYLEKVRKVRATGNADTIDYWLEIGDKTRWFSTILSRHEDGKSVVAVVRDITERKRAELEIRNLQRYNRGLIETSLDPLMTFDRKGIILDVNEATVRATGRSREELVGTPFANHFTDPEKAHRGAMTVFETGEVRNYELVMNAQDGRETIVDCNASIYKDQKGQIAGAFAAARDITERKKDEEEIEKSAVKYRNLAEESMQGIAIFQDGKYTYANPAFARIVGYTVDEMLGLSSEQVWELIHIDDRERMKKHFKALEAGLQFLPMTRFRYVGKDGTSRWVESFSRRIEHEGKPGVQILDIDITEQKRAEERLHAAAETALFHLDLMGHDIRNYLQAIIMAADILKHIDLSLEDQQVFDLIIESVQNSQTLISKICSTRDLLSAPFSDIRLKDALDESLRRVSESHDDVKIEVEYRVRNGVVKADKFLGNLLTNLLENAVLHNNSKIRHLWVVLSEVNEGFEISIADNGPGIPSSKKETLFDPERRFGGVGIHQALRITQKYGGRMNIHDRVYGDSSQGAEFRIWLPKFASSS